MKILLGRILSYEVPIKFWNSSASGSASNRLMWRGSHTLLPWLAAVWSCLQPNTSLSKAVPELSFQWQTGHTGILAMPGGSVCWSKKWAAGLGKNNY